MVTITVQALPLQVEIDAPLQIFRTKHKEYYITGTDLSALQACTDYAARLN